MYQKLTLNRIIFLILAFLLLVFIPGVYAKVNPTNDFYVNDYANILSSSTKDYIMEKSVALNKVDGTQIVVVTVNSLDGEAIEDYAVELFRRFGIGDAKKNNGILILVSVSDRELRIEVGYGLEGIINDGKAGRIRDKYMIPYLKNNNWDEGIKNGYDAIYAEIVKENNLDLEYVDYDSEDYDLIYQLLFFGFLGGLYLGCIVSQYSWKYTFTIIYVVINLVLIKLFAVYRLAGIVSLITYFLSFFFSKDSNGRGGRGKRSSYYGGSSRMRSSGGGFSGGGFSGGGGSSGGGGASGKF